MRKILSLILDYFAILLGGTITGIFVFIQYFNSISLVAGKKIIFSRDIFFYGLFQTLPVMFILISFALVLYKIRHKSYPKASFITYCALSIITWGVFFPLSLTLQKQVYDDLHTVEELKNQQNLSEGFFRKANDSIYYFIKDGSTEEAPVMQLTTPDAPENFAEEKMLDISKDSDFYKYSEPFHDPLSHDSMNDVPFALLNTFSSIKIQAFNAWHKGIISWICFCSFGLALCSVYAFIRFSSWRMINSYCTLAATAIIIYFNYFYFTPKCEAFRTFMRSFFYEGGKLNFFLDNSIEFPLMVINILLSLILIACGIVIAILRNQEER